MIEFKRTFKNHLTCIRLVNFQKKGNLLKIGSWIRNRFKKNNENTLKFLFTSSKPWNQWKLAVSE